MYEKLVKTKGILVLDKPMHQYLEENQLRACKLLAMVEPKDNEKVFNQLAAENFEGCEVTKSADFLVEVINNKHSKGTAVEFLAKYYGISLERVIAVGDQLNDMPMIERAGLGVAVKNAEAALKEKADYVSEYTNEEGAIADIIEKFGFCH